MEFSSHIFTLIKNFFRFRKDPPVSFNDLFIRFQHILDNNNRTMEIIADMEDKQSGQYVFDSKYMEDSVAAIEESVLQSAYNFNFITQNKYFEICDIVESLARNLKKELAGQLVIPGGKTILPLEEIREVMDEAVGNKAYNLFRVLNLPGTCTPKSFVVTIAGFQKFLAFNNLFSKIDELLKSCKEGASVATVSNNIRLLILNGDIPSQMRKDILKAAQAIYPKNPELGHYSVRSSAVGEDGIFSFAGLHDSFLNVPFRELLSCYKKVLASMYNETAIEYRINHNIPLTDMAMAVLYQEMIPAKTSGVAYTVDPNSPQEHVCILGANYGLGKSVVDGNMDVDTFRICRNSPYALLGKRISEKKWMIDPKGSIKKEVDVELRKKSCLTPDQASAIVEIAMIIERFFKNPLDIEWCINSDGLIRILQVRPLGLSRKDQARSPELNALLKKKKVLLKDQGDIAYRGVGAGPVWKIEDKDSIEKFPSGSVLVARYGIPALSGAIPRAAAVITDVGNITGHMATVAREFQIPTIVDTGSATTTLEHGKKITVDAERNVIYEGRINELLHHQLLLRPIFEARYEFQILRRLLRRISPLTLVDPEGTNFTVKGCTTFHDVIRFIHEKSIQALLKIASKPSVLMSRGGKRLKSDIPLNMILIDIGGGIDNENTAKSGWILPEQIKSLPMNALWKGIASEMWNTDPVHADFKGLMSGITRTQAATVAGQTLSGLNLAILGHNYLNLSLRVGYHFTVVDALMGTKPEKNTIYFRFVGGATDISRRSRRAVLINNILERIGFKVEGNGDLVIARAVNSSAERIKHYLYLLGRLIGFVRQLDILMTDDSSVDIYFEQFLKSNNISSKSDMEKRRENHG